MDNAKDEIIGAKTPIPVEEHAKGTEEIPAKKGRGGIIFAAAIGLLAIIGGAVTIYHISQRARHVTTGNARVTADLITLRATSPGFLERFVLYEGREVREGEILGWIENGESFRSPVNGTVVDTNVTIGQHILPMEALATIADMSNIHIQANIYETEIQNVRLGQPVTVTIDAFGNRRFNGYVSNISRINQAELAGMPVALFTGTFRRFTHNVPVRITITDDVNLSYVLGASARVSLPVTGEAWEAPASNRAINSMFATGIVESVNSMNVYGTLPFKVSRIYVEEGERVTAGQVLGRLDTADLDIEMASVQATLRLAEISLASAQHNYGTLRELYGTGAIARNDLLQSEFALQAAVASRQQAQALLDATRLALERAAIIAPIDGTVTAAIAREGSPGMGLLFVVEDTDNLKIATGFRKYDLGRIAPGMEVAIISDVAGSAEYAGIISRINPTFMPASHVALVEAEVLVASFDTSLRIGMNVRLSINLD